MRIETRRVYDVLIIEMIGRLDSPSAGDAEDRILNIVQDEDGRVLLNLEKCAKSGQPHLDAGATPSKGSVAFVADRFHCRCCFRKVQIMNLDNQKQCAR
jgi:hypothetical protein